MIKNKNLILVLCDFICFVASFMFAICLKSGFDELKESISYGYIWIIYAVVLVALYYLFNNYSGLWKHASITEMISTIIAATLGFAIIFLFNLLIKLPTRVDKSTVFIAYLLVVCVTCLERASFRILSKIKRYFKADSDNKRILIVGAGDAGCSLAHSILNDTRSEYKVAGFVDDDIQKGNLYNMGIKIYYNIDSISEYVTKLDIDEIIICIPSASKTKMKRIVRLCNETGKIVKIMPGSIISGDVPIEIKEARKIDVADLLGREETALDIKSISAYLKNKVVMITGGGGSIGSELCRIISKYEPKRVIIFDIYENTAFELQQELRGQYGDNLDVKVLIGSVRDKSRLEEVFATERPEIVFHAAAHKHVPLMEESPYEAIKNNVIGTRNIVEIAEKYLVKKFILISTDKAVNPTNIMGATKRICELIVQSKVNSQNTVFAAVRFGNVLGSNGSVIPQFEKQIKRGGPVTVTHPDITRYFMTISEAARLVVQAGAMAKSGQIFVLDMGEPVKIVDLAREMIKLSGLVPGRDIKIEYIGLRPGEKLYEELLLNEDGLANTNIDNIFISKIQDVDKEQIDVGVSQLIGIIERCGDIRPILQNLVPTYSYKKAVNEVEDEERTVKE